jgi:L,D-transpeptidase ErfK/SrfK
MIKQKINTFTLKLMLLAGLLFAHPAQALTFNIDPHSDIVGEVEYVTSVKGDSLYTIGREHDIGQLEMQNANPKINPNKNLAVGTNVVVPSAYILPPGAREGMVINVAELRVYYFSPDGTTVTTHPLGIGKQGWRTPIGETTIIRKREHPTWTPPDAIRAEAEANGHELPDVVPAGPHNPLGEYAMNLGWNGYEMHGTNAPASVGLRSSHGCMRMYPEDIKNLFNIVEVGTKVRVIYEPYKIGVKDGNMFIEAHSLFTDAYYNKDQTDKFDLLQQTAQTVPQSAAVDWNKAKQFVKEAFGYPVVLTTDRSTTINTTTTTTTTMSTSPNTSSGE